VRRKNARLLSLSDSSLSSQLQNVPLLIISCVKMSTLLRVTVVIVDRQVCQLMLLREERLGRPWCGPSVNLCPSLVPRLIVGPRPRLENLWHTCPMWHGRKCFLICDIDCYRIFSRATLMYYEVCSMYLPFQY
jgi:hypothetical protein